VQEFRSIAAGEQQRPAEREREPAGIGRDTPLRMGPGDVVVDRFEIERLAGSGGMGSVYRAKDRHTGRVVALKTMRIDRADADRFVREARLLAELRHPAIVAHVDHGTTSGGELYLAMEWLEGEDLHARIRRDGLSPKDSVLIAKQVGEALAAAHLRGVIHRDIKPSNVFLCDNDIEKVKVLDFGVAHVTRGGTLIPTQTGMMIGTPGYMAPEQARGNRDVDARADVFAVGCVLFECLTGRAAFAGDHVMAVLAKVLLEEVPRVADMRVGIPASLDELVFRLLSKDPSDRPEDGAALVRELESLEPIGSARPPPPSARRGGLTRSELRLLCVVLVAEVSAANDGTAPTVIPGASVQIDKVRQAARPTGADVEALADGSIIATLSGQSAAPDLAVQAARCALAMRGMVAGARMAVATGRGEVAGHLPVGEVIDRAARILLSSVQLDPESDVIVIDELTAGLLDARFEIDALGDAKSGLCLRGERPVVEATRTLLGKQTPCVGREREIATLEAMLAECISEPIARAVLVTAPAGVGKSRVRFELLQSIAKREDHVEVLMARGDPMSAGSPLGMIAPMIRRAAGVLDGEALSLRRQKLAARVARHVCDEDRARVTEFLGELIGTNFPDEDSVQLRAARGDAMLMGDQMRRAFEDWLAAECAAQPVMIVLEDLQWGDLPTVTFIDGALRNLRDAPFMVLALARPEVRELFPNLWAERELTEIPLHQLTKKASERLVRQVLGDALPKETLARMIDYAAGNALYLEELVRAVAEGGAGSDIPRTVLAMVQSRIERLAPELRRVLRAASVFGGVFWSGGVSELLGEGDRRLAVAYLEELVAREVIHVRGAGKFPNEIEYTFRHALVRDAAYAMLTDRDRALGHRLAGAWLERVGESDAMLLAEHFERGGERETAAGFYQRAAEHALEGNDLVAAVDRAEKAIACGAKEDTIGTLRLIQTEASHWLGRMADKERFATLALMQIDRGEPRWFDAMWHRIEGLAVQGKLDDVDSLAREASEAKPSEGAEIAALRCLYRAVRRLYMHGHYEAADRLMTIADERTDDRARTDPHLATDIHEAVAKYASRHDDRAVNAISNESALETSQAAGDHRRACNIEMNLGCALALVGDYARAEEILRHALTVSERMGLERLRAYTMQNLGHVLADRGSVQDARQFEERTLELAANMGDVRLEGCARAYLVDIALAQGDLDLAEREGLRSIELLRTAAPLRPMATAQLARALLARGRTAEALDQAQEAMRIKEQLGSIEEGQFLVPLVYAQALEASGRKDEARRVITQSRDELVSRAEQIRDPTWRRNYLENVPEHVRTVSLARAWEGEPG